MMTRSFLSLLFLCSFVAAQSITVGAKVGGVWPDVYAGASYQFIDESKCYTFGPSVEVRLPKGLSAEFDVLYRRIGFDRARFGSDPTLFNDRERANSWEFPILAKYGPKSLHGARPYVLGGWSPRLVAGQAGFSLRYAPSQGNWDIVASTTYTRPNTTLHGVVAGAGVEFHKSRFRFSPEFRYTHWDRAFVANEGIRIIQTTKQDQFQILLGVSFGWRN